MPHLIGTAGYTYPHWRSTFYPPGLPIQDELRQYHYNFATVEINATWHGFPRLSTLKNWAKAGPIDVRFSLKAPSIITHQKRLQNVDDDIDAFCKLAREGLIDRLGVILFQCPPSLLVTTALLGRFLEAVTSAQARYGTFRVALELRHPDNLTEPILGMLASHNVALVNNICVSDSDFFAITDALPHIRGRVNTPQADWSYNRFHGSKRPGVFTDFPESVLREFADASERDSYSYFLNDLNAIAPRNAKEYRKICADVRGVSETELSGGWTGRSSVPRVFQKWLNSNAGKKNEKEKNGKEGVLDSKVAGAANNKGPSVRKTGKGNAVNSKAGAGIKKKSKKGEFKDIASFFK